VAATQPMSAGAQTCTGRGHSALVLPMFLVGRQMRSFRSIGRADMPGQNLYSTVKV